MSAILRGPGVIDLHAAREGDGHLFAVPGSQTVAWSPGKYSVSIRVTDGVDVFEIEQGESEIGADLASVSAGHDARSQVERTLEAINAVIEGRASKDQQSYTINGRTLVRSSIADLLLLQKAYEDKLAKLKRTPQSRRLLRRQIKVRM